MRWILVIAASVALASPALAAPPACTDGEMQPRFGAGPLGNPRFAERIADRLDLAPEQRDTLQGIVSTHRDAMKTLAAQHQDALCSFADAAPTDPDYAVSTATASQAASALAAGGIELVAQLRSDFQAVLTEEQLAEWQVVRAEMFERMERRRNKGDRRNR